MQGIEDQQTSRRITYIGQVGWAGTTFVLPNEMIGSGHADFHVELRDGYPMGKFACAESVAAYQAEVVALATGNHVLIFVLGLAFMGPLLRLLGEEGGGVQLVAGTRSGKSTALEMAGSVWGLQYAETWRTTTNAVERTAADHNDLLLVLDEAALLGKDPRSRFDAMYEVVHYLYAGREKQRLTSPHQPVQFLNLFLSASELTFPELARLGNRVIIGGELMRLIDIKLRQTKAKGIFQNLHDAPTHRRFCARLRKTVAGCHGTIGREYLRRLVRDVEEDQDGLVVWLRERADFYLRRACLADQEPEAETVASRFALAYAALRLAAHYKLLPWSWREMYAAVRYCHKRASTESDSPLSAKAAAGKATSQRALVAAAKERIARHRKDLVKVESKVSTSVAEKAPGFVHDGKNGMELLFTQAKFQEIVCNGDDSEPMLDALRASGLLVVHQGGKLTIPRSLPAPLGRKRVVCIKGEIERL